MQSPVSTGVPPLEGRISISLFLGQFEVGTYTIRELSEERLSAFQGATRGDEWVELLGQMSHKLLAGMNIPKFWLFLKYWINNKLTYYDLVRYAARNSQSGTIWMRSWYAVKSGRGNTAMYGHL